MVYKAKGRLKYGSYSDSSSYSEGASGQSNLTSIQRVARRLKASLPEEFKFDIPTLIKKINPDWLNPYHLKALTGAFDDIQAGKRVKLLHSVGPRMGKSETIIHGVVRFLATHKNKEVLYISYAQDIAEDKSRIVREYCQKLGLEPLRDTNSLSRWKLSNGCSFRCAGLSGGQITGKGADLLIIDDPHKDRADVESGTKRDRVYNSVCADVFTRLSPDASIICNSTRWHPDDLIGRLIASPDIKFNYVNLPAFNADGESIWPERWSTERLKESRALVETDYEWSSLYMGNPQPRGSAVFNGIDDSNFYSELPSNLKYAVGYDLAYTEKTHADHSVALVMATDGKNIYIVDIVRCQVDATKFAKELWKLRSKYPKSMFLSYISGPEKGSVSLLNSTGLNLSFLQARTDKFDRSQSVSAAWNNGKVFIPKSAPWLNKFLSEILNFTGISDKKDDQVDALAGAFAALSMGRARRDLTNLPPA